MAVTTRHERAAGNTAQRALRRSGVMGFVWAILIGMIATTAQAGLITVETTTSGAVQDTNPSTALEDNPFTFAFSAGASASKLVVTLSSEKSSQVGPTAISYNGSSLAQIVNTATGRNTGIWFLDNPFTGGSATLSIDMTAWDTVNGIGYSVIALSGTADGYADSNVAQGLSVGVTSAGPGSFAVANLGAQFRNVISIPDEDGNVPLYTDNIGSAVGAAFYRENVGEGPQTLAFAASRTNEPENTFTSAAVFSVPEPTTLALSFFGVAGLLWRRRSR